MDSQFSCSKKARVLIVDDEAEIRAILADLLSNEFECVSVGSAEDALAELSRSEYQLILSDITMGELSGLDMIPLARAQAPHVVIVVISGLQTIESAIDALRLGAFDYIMKPFDLRQVEAAISRALEHYELLEAKRRYETRLEELVQERTRQLDRALSSVEESYRATLKALAAALETRDQETHGHSERVVTFSLRLGREMGLDADTLRSLEFGALLHDIGKIGVPDAILRKPAKLDEDEWLQMRLHPLHGKNILREIPFLADAARLVAEHHEKWDGTGYPVGLRAEEIIINARIFAVADAFDAMVSDRVYRAGRSYEAAREELERCAGAHFDPQVVEAFKRVPPQEWDDLKRRSLLVKKPEPVEPRSFDTMATLIEARLASLIA